MVTEPAALDQSEQSLTAAPAEALPPSEFDEEVVNYLRKIGLPPDQIDEVKNIFSRYRERYVAMERRHTKINRDNKGHIEVLGFSWTV